MIARRSSVSPGRIVLRRWFGRSLRPVAQAGDVGQGVRGLSSIGHATGRKGRAGYLVPTTWPNRLASCGPGSTRFNAYRGRRQVPRQPCALAGGVLDYAFIDGNHQEAATVAYFNGIAAQARSGCAARLRRHQLVTWNAAGVATDRNDTRVAVHSVTGRFGVVILSGKSYEPGGV
jgi:hypothetical protein